MNVVVFISGTGSNLAAIIKKQHQFGYKVCLVVSNNKKAKGLEFARNNNIPVFTFDWDKNDKHLTIVQDQINKHNCHLIVLAGFMKILPAEFVQSYKHNIINIHPSLLPKYPGLHTHQRVIDNKDKQHGATVHYVNDKLDAGTIISQVVIKVEKSADAKSLSKQLLFSEHSLLPFTMGLIVENRVEWHGDLLCFDQKTLTNPIIINE